MTRLDVEAIGITPTILLPASCQREHKNYRKVQEREQWVAGKAAVTPTGDTPKDEMIAAVNPNRWSSTTMLLVPGTHVMVQT